MDNFYKAPNSNLGKGRVSHSHDDIEYAGFWVRALASLIDSIWIVILIFTLGWMIYGAMYFESEKLVAGGADIFISYVLPFLITLAFWFYKSATPGKMAVGVKIVDAETLEPASKGKLAIRYIGYYPSSIVFCMGFFWIGWDPKKQGWHDKMAGTLVIKN